MKVGKLNQILLELFNKRKSALRHYIMKKTITYEIQKFT